ncbi:MULTISPECIES: hypothetical protein [Metallosphaera]
MRDYEGERLVIWLAYFTAPSRAKGRRALKAKIGLKELVDICRELGLDPIEVDKVHPASKIRGLVAVRKVNSKVKIIKEISRKVGQLRSDKPS